MCERTITELLRKLRRKQDNELQNELKDIKSLLHSIDYNTVKTIEILIQLQSELRELKKKLGVE